jgi:ABC-type uncharacterized transport system permease subunit
MLKDFLDIIYSVIPLGIAFTAPLAIIALGGLFSERSGVVNIGLEGLMGIGAFASAITIVTLFPNLGDLAVWIGLLAAVAAGVAFSLLHAFASVNMKANQVISGTAINLLSMAITVYLARTITGSANIQIMKGFYKIDIPLLSQIPFIGPLFFKPYITTVLVLVIFAVSWFVLYKRPFGLRLRACGENPQAADSMGINVGKMRYIGVMMSGALAGLGGAIVITTFSNEFSVLIYNGLGFLALASLIFGKWRVWSVLGAAAFFGMAKTVADLSKLFSFLQDKPNIIFNTFPFVVTLIALIIFSKNAAGPKAAGEPYDVGKR